MHSLFETRPDQFSDSSSCEDKKNYTTVVEETNWTKPKSTFS